MLKIHTSARENLIELITNKLNANLRLRVEHKGYIWTHKKKWKNTQISNFYSKMKLGPRLFLLLVQVMSWPDIQLVLHQTHRNFNEESNGVILKIVKWRHFEVWRHRCRENGVFGIFLLFFTIFHHFDNFSADLT